MTRTTLKIEGMSCGHCVNAVRSALADVEGVAVEEVGIGSATVSYDPAQVSPQKIVEAVSEAGYGAAPAA
jgi:copper chaperone